MIVNARFLTQKITGVQRYSIEMSLKLKELHPGIRFLAPRNIIQHEIAGKLGAERIGFFEGYFWEQIELPLFLKRHAPGSILINPGNMAPVFYRRNIAVIHDMAPLRHPEWYSRKFSIAYRVLWPIIGKRALKIVSDSEHSKKEIIELLKVEERMVEVIPCGISEEFSINPGTNRPNEFGDYILAVSSIDPRKNFAGIIGAFKSLKIDNLNLVIAGSKEKIFAEQRLKDLAGDDKRIFFSGFMDTDELANLYSRARMLVYPSFYEGFGLPPIEAMARKCPCIVSGVSSLPEVCGPAALYCDPYNQKDIADKIETLFFNDQLRQTLIERGLERVRLYSWEKSAGALLRVAEEIIKR